MREEQDVLDALCYERKENIIHFLALVRRENLLKVEMAPPMEAEEEIVLLTASLPAQTILDSSGKMHPGIQQPDFGNLSLNHFSLSPYY